MISITTSNGSVSINESTLLKYPYFVNTLETMGTLEGTVIPFTYEDFIDVINPSRTFYTTLNIEILEFLLADGNTMIHCQDMYGFLMNSISLNDINRYLPKLKGQNFIKRYIDRLGDRITDILSYDIYLMVYSDLNADEIMSIGERIYNLQRL